MQGDGLRRDEEEGLHVSTFTGDQRVGRLIPQDSPQDTDGFASGGDTGNARMFGNLQVFVVAHEDGLMQEQGSHGIHQSAAEIDIAGFEDVVALAFTLAVAGVVAATDQARAAEDLSGAGVVGGIADGGSQAGDLNCTQALELGPDLIGCLGHELDQALFELMDVASGHVRAAPGHVAAIRSEWPPIPGQAGAFCGLGR